MNDTLISLHDTPVWLCAPTGDLIRSERDAVQLIGDARGYDAVVVVVPVTRLDPTFFQLRSRVAGDLIQKFLTYGFRLAILGDITEHLAASNAFRDFVYEANVGAQFWFVSDLADLERRLQTAS